MKLNLNFIDTRIAGIDLLTKSDGTYTFNFTILKKSGNNILSEKSGVEISEFKQLFDCLDKKVPVLLSLNGKGILHKKIVKGSDSTPESSLSKILPNSKIEDFYIQLYEISDIDCFVSVVRKNFVDSIVNSFNAENFKLIGLVLGPFSIQSILLLLSSAEQPSFELKFLYYDLLISQGLIQNYTPLANEEPANVITQNSFTINCNELVSYSSAFLYFNPAPFLSSNIGFVNNACKEYKGEIRFKKTGGLIMASVFILLLSNFIISIYLSGQVQTKLNQFAHGSNVLNKVDSLKRQIEERTVFLSKSGLSEPSRTSFYADEIAKDLPSSILLSTLNIQPLVKDDDKKKIAFENKKIIVSGTSKYALDINDWMRQLKQRSWIKAVTLLDYKQKEGNDPGEFIIEIKLN